MLFDVERRTTTGRSVLTVRGELDLTTAPQLESAVAESLAAGARDLVVDLEPTRFLDSSGARTLMTVARTATAAGAVLHVVAPRDNTAVRLTIDLLDLGAYVPVVGSLDEIPTGLGKRDAGP